MTSPLAIASIQKTHPLGRRWVIKGDNLPALVPHEFFAPFGSPATRPAFASDAPATLRHRVASVLLFSERFLNLRHVFTTHNLTFLSQYLGLMNFIQATFRGSNEGLRNRRANVVRSPGPGPFSQPVRLSRRRAPQGKFTTGSDSHFTMRPLNNAYLLPGVRLSDKSYRIDDQ
jgi:hypothetical protein